MPNAERHVESSWMKLMMNQGPVVIVGPSGPEKCVGWDAVNVMEDKLTNFGQ